MLAWILLLIGLYVLYKLLIEPLNYWKLKDVPYNTPLPFVGNLGKVVAGKLSFYDCMVQIYTAFPNRRYYGLFQFTQPTLVIRDIELVKRITVKDFDHFTDHRDIGSTNVDELFSKNLANLNGQEWKDMRSLLSPAFTGSKMKAMFPLMADCAKQMADHFLSKQENIVEVEMKDTFTRYTNDVIATCAFGVTCDSLKDPENTFYKMGEEVTAFRGIRGFIVLLANFAPKIVKFLGIAIFPKKISDFFTSTIFEAIAYRNKHNVIRPDMVHLLMEARKGKLKHEEETKMSSSDGFSVIEESSLGKKETQIKEITDLDIAAQAFIFFFAGFDTSSTLLSFMSTELALNPDVQEKLIQEVDEVIASCNGKITYEAISQMKYMDLVVSETLRKWPAAPMTDRKCTKRFVIEAERPDEKQVVLEIDDSITIPIAGIQRDPTYFPNPEKFDPERFSEENKHKILPFTYLPFGLGPRACIGSRFALLEVKIVFVYMLSKFEMIPIKKTVAPIKLSTKGIRIQPEGGFWLGLKARKN